MSSGTVLRLSDRRAEAETGAPAGAGDSSLELGVSDELLRLRWRPWRSCCPPPLSCTVGAGARVP
eukprot:3994094-Prymnesium_polylepis.1